MGSKFQSPALSDAKSLGGIIAQDGFDYQLWDGLARLPVWLANPAFEELIFEGLEDLEARFFAPQAPRQRLLERYQAKSGNLAPNDVRGVLATFQTFERAYPGLARMHTLVTPRLPPTVDWLARDPATARLAHELSLFSEPDGARAVFARGGVPPEPGVTTSALSWNPAAGVELVVVAARSGPATSFVAVFDAHPDGRHRVVASFILEGETGPIAFGHDARARERVRFGTCWGCLGEMGRLLYREPDRVLITQP